MLAFAVCRTLPLASCVHLSSHQPTSLITFSILYRSGDACVNGKFANDIAGQKCDECEAGQYLLVSPTPGAQSKCEDCPPVSAFGFDAVVFASASGLLGSCVLLWYALRCVLVLAHSLAAPDDRADGGNWFTLADFCVFQGADCSNGVVVSKPNYYLAPSEDGAVKAIQCLPGTVSLMPSCCLVALVVECC